MKHIVILLSLLVLAGCATTPANKQSTQQVAVDSNMSKSELRFALLQKEFAQWRGAPYRYGGTNKSGIDCSAFVQIIYRDSFGVALPRTTGTQVKQGYPIYRERLQVGDLVFFKTAWNVRHVGIYMGEDSFIHASTSKGVIRSSLDNVYWKANYWQARRILD